MEQHSQRIIMGIDPGNYILGYGVILVDNKRAHYIDMGVVNLKSVKDHFSKLNIIFNKVSELISQYKPDHLAIEAPFYGKNPQVMLKLGRAQGAAIAAAIKHDMQVYEYAPRKVKMAITGNGAASKEQVSAMLSRTLDVVLNPEYLDATDAIAIALCHYYQLTNPLADISNSTSWKKFLEAHPEKIKN